MSNRSSSSSARATGGLNAAGNPLDTLLVIPGDGKKEILTLTWAFSALGHFLPVTDLLTSRIVAVAGDLSQALTANLATGFPDALAGLAGRIMFDSQVIGGLMLSSGNGTTAFTSLPTAGQFLFPSDSTEGEVSVDSGPISILMTAPAGASTGNAPSNVIGVLSVQYANNATNQFKSDGAPGYAYTPLSQKAR